MKGHAKFIIGSKKRRYIPLIHKPIRHNLLCNVLEKGQKNKKKNKIH